MKLNNSIWTLTNTSVYLERFLRNLLLGEQWDLRNRYLHIHPSPEWSVQPRLDTPTSTPTSLSLPDSIAGGYVRLRYPDKPRHPQQRYLLTEKGTLVLESLSKKNV